MSIREFAHAYRKIGWNVIPLYHFSKNPAPLKWKTYEERLSTDEEFNTWFDDPQVTGLGLITGKLSGIVAVDEDSYKANGMAFEFTSPMVSKTARNGRHHFFRYTVPIKTSGFRQGVNIEIKSDGGFLVLPPSQVHTNEIKLGTGTYEWLAKCHPNNLPTITEAQLLPYRGNISQQSAVEIASLVNAPLGMQHNNLRTIALATFNRFREREWDLAENFVRHAATTFDPPHPEHRVEKIIQDAKVYVKIHPKDTVEEAVQKETKNYTPVTTNQLAEMRIRDRKLEAIAPRTPWPELDRLIKGFIPGHLYTLTGDTNVGKTAIACNFTESLREQGKKVLYIALEPDVNLVEYLASVRRRKAFADISDDELRIIGTGDDQVHVFLGESIQTVEDLIFAIEDREEERYDLVIIDHIGYFVHSERDWIQKQSNVIKQLKLFINKKKIAAVIIAHLRKPAAGRKKDEMWIPTHDDIAGSAAFKQDSTEVLIAIREVQKSEDNRFGVQFSPDGWLLVTKTKTGPQGQVPLIFTEKSACIYSKEQLQELPEQKQAYDKIKYLETQMRLGDEKNDVWEKKY